MQQTFKQYLISEGLFTEKEVRSRGKQELTRMSKLQQLSSKLNIPLKDIENMSPRDIKTIIKYVGKHDYAPDSEFNTKELKMGVKVEMEHTNNRLVAELIAKDHLKEIKDYYTRLKKMEMEANRNRDRHDSDFL
jgi:flagellar hook assembly protein FlgD